MALLHILLSFIPLIAYSATGIPLSNAQSSSADPAALKERGWRIFREAREAANMHSPERPVKDYTMNLVTRTHTPQGEVALPSKIYFVSPGLVRQEIAAPTGKVVMVFDGAKGWRVLGGGVHHLPSNMVDRYREELTRSHVLLNPPEPDTAWFLRQEEVDGRMADVIELREVGGPPLRLFVDTETRDVIKKMFIGDSPSGMAQVEEFYSDFREVGGYRWPFQKRVLRNGEPALESQISEMRFNVGLAKSDILE